ncbi:MAG TPA: SDR family NAD(P)-dependent oxidoreductase [Solirubrobacterales bacterium]|jgi:short-subunit dehydrogenase|nr:SDR family NAD(P)-dependent oxidoreductase [Solirubrobacterales bacterium]
MVELRGSRALVTGAGGGLGGYISRAVGGQGANLVVSDLPGSEIEARAEELGRMGVEARAVAADLTDSAERARLVREAEEAIGPLDVLINNAGLEFGGAFTKTTREEIEAIATVNLIAVMDLTWLVLPGMLERRRGHVVNLASLAGKIPSVFLATYAATKHGVVGFTHSLRAEYADEPVSFSAICPAFVADVGMYARAEQDMDTEPPPGLRPVPPQRVADAVLEVLRENRAEVIVSRGPLRPLAVLYWLAPKTTVRLLGNRRTRPYAEDYARARGRL